MGKRINSPSDFKTIHENKFDLEKFYINSFQLLKKRVKELNKHECVNGELTDGNLVQSQDGKYVLLEDVLNLL